MAARGDELIVLYDGECGFCAVMLALLLSWDRARRLDPAAIQSPRGEGLLADVAREDRLESWHVFDARGVRRSASAAGHRGRLRLGGPPPDAPRPPAERANARVGRPRDRRARGRGVASRRGVSAGLRDLDAKSPRGSSQASVVAVHTLEALTQADDGCEVQGVD
jgi:hypothetical protein